MLRTHSSQADIIDTAVIGFTHHRIYRPNRLIAVLRQRPVNHTSGRLRHRQGISQQDWRLHLTQLNDLGCTHHLSVTIAL